MGIEKYFSVGRKFAAVGGLVLILASCKSLYEIPKRAAEEVIDITYRIGRLPLKTMSWLKSEPPVNGCVENLNEKVCRLYLKSDTPEFGKEEYFGVYHRKKNLLWPDESELVLGFRDEDGLDMFDGGNL